MKEIKLSSKTPQIAFITDLHGDNHKAIDIVNDIKKYKIELIILGGDILDNNVRHARRTLKIFTSLKIPIYFMPGSHENYDILKKIIKEFKKHLLLDTTIKRNRLVKIGKYKLIFIPGSDVLNSGTGVYKGGNVKLLDIGLKRSILRQEKKHFKEMKIAKSVKGIFFDDIITQVKKHIKGLKKYRIMFCHIPPQCFTGNGIDRAHFGLIDKNFIIKKTDMRKKLFKETIKNPIFFKNHIVLLNEAKILKEYKYPINLHKSNVGNENLNYVINSCGVKKFFCGHIHEAGRRAINFAEVKLRQNTPHNEILANSGEARQGKYTIITLLPNGLIEHKFRIAK